MNPEILYKQLNDQVKDSALDIVKIVQEYPDYWWTVGDLMRAVPQRYSKAAVGLAVDRLIIDEVLVVKPSAIDRVVKLKPTYASSF